MMKRRDFLNTATAALPLAFANVPIAAPRSPLFNLLQQDDSDRVLVLIQLVGGNDGLNSVVPLDAYDNLRAVRGNIVASQNRLLRIESTRALHPSLKGMKEVWDSGRLGIVQGVGYPDQNRSHFRSTDIWTTGSASKENLSTGWVGRFLDTQHPGYPNNELDYPAAVSVGTGVSETCQGVGGNFALAVDNPLDQTTLLDMPGEGYAGGIYGDELDYIRTTIAQANTYGRVVKKATERGRNAVRYPDRNELATKLSYVTRMIAGGLRSKVYIVSLGGFDTHASQVVSGNPTAGNHAELLRELSEAVLAFQDDLRAQGLEKRVIGMTYSEFGRQIRSNAAHGTDHGTAAPAFVFGECVAAGTLGANPVIKRDVASQEGVAMQYDFRDLYGSVLEDWFGLSDRQVRDMLHKDYVKLPIISGCGSGSSTSSVADASGDGGLTITASPSPFKEGVNLSFTTAYAGRVRCTAYDVQGRLVEELFSRRLPAGEQQVSVDTSDYPAGVIIFRLQEGSRVRVARAIHQ